jgi:hypothetical protein
MFNKHYFVFFLLLFLITACESLIEGPEDELNNGGSNGIRATFSSIQAKVFSPTCALSGCHGGSQNPNLSAGQAYNNLVNKASVENPSILRVKPGDSMNSLIIKKLRGDGTSVMPPSGQLSQATIDSIIVWINDGALNN